MFQYCAEPSAFLHSSAAPDRHQPWPSRTSTHGEVSSTARHGESTDRTAISLLPLEAGSHPIKMCLAPPSDFAYLSASVELKLLGEKP